MRVSPSAEAFSRLQFDYIVIGGGNAGLPLAVRLAEDPRVTVGLLEAGSVVEDDPLVTQPRLIGMASGNPSFDWNFMTEPQQDAGQRSISLPRGKGLGGSTLLNYLVWDRASKGEYDSWKNFSDPEGAWDWDSLLPYFKKSENASATKSDPDPYTTMSLPDAQIASGGTPDEEASGWDGPVRTSYNTLYTDVMAPAIKAFNSIGVPTNANPYGGETYGIKNLRRAVSTDSGKRINAASAYLGIAENFENLHILSNAMVTKLLFAPSADAQGNQVVQGAKFTVDGETYNAGALKEVILSCGAIQTPQLLELSGIGKSSLLKSLGIPVRVDLPGVGENLHDHIFAPIQYLLRPGVKTFDEFRNNAEFLAKETAKYDSSGQGWFAANDSTAVYNPLHKVVEATEYDLLMSNLKTSISLAQQKNALTPLQIEQYRVQVKWLEENYVPNLETIILSKGIVAPAPGKSYFVMLTGIQHPFSRGSVHITTADPLRPPKIDPNYMSHDFDVEMLAAGFRFMEKVSSVSYLKDVIEAQAVPPAPLSKEQLIGFIKQAVSSGAHLMGTAPLARRDLGGVVDNKLRVYGTSNLRIADASIIPIPVATHIQATVYAIAEKAADLIKEDHQAQVSS